MQTRRKIVYIVGIIIALFIVLIFTRAYLNANRKISEEVAIPKTVELINLSGSESDLENLDITGKAQAAADVDILPEASGIVRKIYKKEGDKVKAGTIILELENTDERIAVSRAQSQLNSAKVTLQEMIDDSLGSEGSTFIEITEQQELAVLNAYESLLNNDLRAYSDDPSSESSQGPIVTGTYSGPEGEYVLKTYPSNTVSGVSFRLSGLENGSGPVSTVQPTALGKRGLFVQFPNVSTNNLVNRTWIIPIPNTRSSTYISARNAYEAAKEGKDVVLKQAEVNSEDIERQKAIVLQQELALNSAQVAFSRTIIRSPINGTITSFDLDKGDFVGLGKPTVSVKSLDDLEIVAYVTERDKTFIKTDSKVVIDDEISGVITNVGNSVDPITQKIKVRISVDSDKNNKFIKVLTEGQSVRVSIPRDNQENVTTYGGYYTIPLSAVQIIGTTTNVFSVDENNIVYPVQVKTGALLGSSVMIISGLEDIDYIIKDARGIKEGEVVNIK